MSEISDVLVDQMATLADGASPTIRIDWHLSEEDLRAEAADGMKRLARRAIAGSALAFVFDRPRCPIALAEGVDRGNPAVLLTVGLNLPVLATQMGTGTDAAGRFLQRLPSLVRLALSAGVQKRDFLRQHSPDQSELKRGFLLDRARLVVAPIGIQPTVQRLLGQSPYETPEALDYARRIVERLHDVVKEDGSSRHLDVVLDGSRLGKPQGEPDGKSQLHFATELSRGGSLGTLCLFFSEAGMPRQDEFVDWLRLAWKRSEITRLQIVTVGETDPQLKFDS